MSSVEHTSAAVNYVLETLPAEEIAVAINHTHRAVELLGAWNAESADTRAAAVSMVLHEAVAAVAIVGDQLHIAHASLMAYLSELELAGNGQELVLPANNRPSVSAIRANERGVEQDPPVHMAIQQVTKLPPQPMGGAVHFVVEATINGEPIQLLELTDVDAKSYQQKWEAFHAAGLPVPAMYFRTNWDGQHRPSERDNTVMIPDPKADGSESYGTQMVFAIAQAEEPERRRPEIDQIFMDITSPEKFPAIRAKLEEYLEIAKREHLFLGWADPYQLVVHPDGTWDIVMTGLNRAQVYGPWDKYVRSGELHEKNQVNVQSFIANLRSIRAAMLGLDHNPPRSDFARRWWLKRVGI